MRTAVLILGGVLLFGGAFGAGYGFMAWPATVVGALIVIGVLAERVIYKPLSQRPPRGWQRTGERFVDDATGKTVEVFYDPKSGQRQYVDRG
jgi:hypothetical protein